MKTNGKEDMTKNNIIKAFSILDESYRNDRTHDEFMRKLSDAKLDWSMSEFDERKANLKDSDALLDNAADMLSQAISDESVYESMQLDDATRNKVKTIAATFAGSDKSKAKSANNKNKDSDESIDLQDVFEASKNAVEDVHVANMTDVDTTNNALRNMALDRAEFTKRNDSDNLSGDSRRVDRNVTDAKTPKSKTLNRVFMALGVACTYCDMRRKKIEKQMDKWNDKVAKCNEIMQKESGSNVKSVSYYMNELKASYGRGLLKGYRKKQEKIQKNEGRAQNLFRNIMSLMTMKGIAGNNNGSKASSDGKNIAGAVAVNNMNNIIDGYDTQPARCDPDQPGSSGKFEPSYGV